MKMSGSIIFNWSVENFSMCLKKLGTSIDTPEFFIDKKNNVRGILKLYPFGWTQNKYITIYLIILKGSLEFKDAAYCKLSILSSKKSEMDIMQNPATGEMQHRKISSLRTAIYKDKENFLPNDVLTAKCEIKIRYDSLTSEIYHCNTNIGFRHHRFEYPIKCIASDGVNGLISSTDSTRSILFHKQLNDSEIKNDFFSQIECVKSAENINLFEVNLSITGNKICFATISILLTDSNSDCCLAFEEISESSKNLLKVTFTLNDDQLLSLKNNSSSIICDLKISAGSAITILETQKNSNYTFKKTSLRFLQKIYTDKEFCDVVLQVGNNQFAANKCVLAAASPVFKAMFKSGMEESKTNVVTITDIEASTIDKMLEVLYTESLEHLHIDVVTKLYVAADKYQISELKENCIEYLLNNLSTENICEVLELAESLNDFIMIKIAHDFIYSHHKKVFSTNIWKNFIEKQPKLSADIMASVLERIYL